MQQQIEEMIARREAAIATLQTELEALRVTASLLAKQEKEPATVSLSPKPSEKPQSDVFSAGNAPAGAKTTLTNLKSQFV